MYPRYLSGLAALVLLSVPLVPGAGAIVVNSGNILMSPGLPEHSKSTYSGTWSFPRYDDSLVPLTSVRVIVDFQFGGSVSETNPFDPSFWPTIPSLNVTPFLNFQGSVFMNDDAGVAWFFQNATTTVTGPSTTLQYLERTTWSGSAPLSMSFVFTAPSDVAHFVGSGTGLLRPFASITHSSWYGSGGGGAGVQARIIFGVPDNGPTTLSMLAALGGMVMLHLIRKAGRRT